MSIVRAGATKKYSDNWANIFGGKKSSAKGGSTAVAAKGNGKSTKAAVKKAPASPKKKPAAKKGKK